MAKFKMQEDIIKFSSKDGTILLGILAEPKIPPKGGVVLAHGITAEKNEDGFYNRLAEALAERGFQSLRFDFRGHGASAGIPKEMTIHGEVQDLSAAVDQLRKLGWRRVAIVGTSFGGGVAVLYSEHHQKVISCLTLLCPVLDYKRTFLNPETEWTKEWFVPQAFNKAEKTGFLDLDGFHLGRKLLEEFKALNPAEVLLKLEVPTLLVHGTEDTMVPYIVSKNVGPKYPHRVFVPVEGADHGFEGFEDKVFPKVWQWIFHHLAA